MGESEVAEIVLVTVTVMMMNVMIPIVVFAEVELKVTIEIEAATAVDVNAAALLTQKIIICLKGWQKTSPLSPPFNGRERTQRCSRAATSQPLRDGIDDSFKQEFNRCSACV